MDRHKRFNPSRLLKAARVKLNVKFPHPPKKGVIFRLVADALNRPCPIGAESGYEMLQEFVAATEIQPRPLIQFPTRTDYRAESDKFLRSSEWRRLRMLVITKRGARCECCGATPNDGIRINVDHIKPRKLFPDLALVESNLQVLCDDCNHGKGNWDQTDWRVNLSKP